MQPLSFANQGLLTTILWGSRTRVQRIVVNDPWCCYLRWQYPYWNSVQTNVFQTAVNYVQGVQHDQWVKDAHESFAEGFDNSGSLLKPSVQLTDPIDDVCFYTGIFPTPPHPFYTTLYAHIDVGIKCGVERMRRSWKDTSIENTSSIGSLNCPEDH